MKRLNLTVIALAALVVCTFLAGVSASEAAAGPAREVVGLGSPAATIIAADGHPAKITFGPDQQTWYYVDDGALRARYDVNQGLVVRLRKSE